MDVYSVVDGFCWVFGRSSLDILDLGMIFVVLMIFEYTDVSR